MDPAGPLPLPVLLTRSAADNRTLARALRRRGFATVSWATARVGVLPVREALSAALALADVVACTSRAAVAAVRSLAGDDVWPRLQAGGVRLAAVGPATARALRRAGARPDICAATADGAALAAAIIADRAAPTARVVCPQAAAARPELADALRRGGCVVDVVAVYVNEPPPPPSLRAREAAATAALAVYCAPSAVERVAAWMPALLALPAVAIGPTTSAALRAHGVAAAAVAQAPTTAALLAAVERVAADLGARGGAEEEA